MLDVQQQRARAHRRIVGAEALLLFVATRDNVRQERRYGLRRIEFTGLLAHVRCKVTDHVLIGIAEDIAAVAVEVQRSQCCHDVGDQLIALLRRRAELGRVQVHIVKEMA